MLSGQSLRGINLDFLDYSVRPCDDFYQFANGRWLADNPIPSDRVACGVGTEMQERKLAALRQILEEAVENTSAPTGSVERKVGDFYRSGMDVITIESEGFHPLDEALNRIDSIKNLTDLWAELAQLHRYKIFPIFQSGAYQDFTNSARIIPWLYQGRLGLPHCDHYIKQDIRSKEIRKEYTVHVANMLTLLDDSHETAAAGADTVIEIEARLAEASTTLVEQRDPNTIHNIMSLTQLDSLTPNFSWKDYFSIIGLSEPGHINVAQPEFFGAVGKMIRSFRLNDWKIFLRWKLISATADKLSAAFVAEDFRFNGMIVHGLKELKPRWKRVAQIAEQSLAEALGPLYAIRSLSDEAKVKVASLVTNLKAALCERLSKLDWISEKTRQQALRKLAAMVIKIGCPDNRCDYNELAIDRGPFVLNVLRANAFEFQRTLSKIGKPVDRAVWELTSSTVDAHYNPNFNEIVLPAAILQPPLFDPGADDATNYGALGSIIGHEMVHGFDDQGRKFDAEGNLRKWWSEEDEKTYQTKAELMVEQFNNYTVIDGIRINGRLTLGENIADLGGLKIAYLAFQKNKKRQLHPTVVNGGFTPEQRFFIAFAQIWRCNVRPDMVRLMLTADTHSPPRFRVLGTLLNMAEFFEAFACQTENKPPRAISSLIDIW